MVSQYGDHRTMGWWKSIFQIFKGGDKRRKDHDVSGTIISIVPNKEISYTWDFTTKPEYNKNTIVRWQLEQLDNNKTKITLIHSGFTNVDRIQYDEQYEGWDWYTKRLDSFIRNQVNKEG